MTLMRLILLIWTTSNAAFGKAFTPLPLSTPALSFSGLARLPPRRPTTSLSASSSGGGPVCNAALMALRGGAAAASAASDLDLDLASSAWEWLANLGAPAALVAGAVLATLDSTRTELSPTPEDDSIKRNAKVWCRFLLLSSFALEVISIFVTTVTGTMLLSHADRSAGAAAGQAYHSTMGFLRYNHEFEYLTARISFLQGFFNWLAAIALESIIPKEGEGASARQMNIFIFSSLVTLILCMLSFYNHHMTFYENYFEMLTRYVVVVFKRFLWHWPFRPMTFITFPMCVVTTVLGVRALFLPKDLDKED